VEANLEPQVLGILEALAPGARVVLREPLGPRSERVVVSGATGQTTTFVVQRLWPRGGWVAQATQDDRMRAYRLTTAGILRALPTGIGTAVLRAVALGEGAVLVQRDVAAGLLPPGTTLTPAQAEAVLRGLARMHATFCGFPARLTADLGLCALPAWLTRFSPATVRATPGVPPAAAANIERGWHLLAEAAPDLWQLVAALLDDPGPLVRGLRACADTIAHGALALEHVAVEGEMVTLLGWDEALRAPGAVDLGVLLSASGAALPLTVPEVRAIYQAERARIGRLPATGELWEREVTLGLLAGLLRAGWATPGHARYVMPEVSIARHWLEQA
jgi:hypothetical protein